ncbi:major facilitator superfamily MFS_1 [Pseudarthrobacter chlorophenolicus A6]|uniref:Major facilitator superfamily MFS_1 n=1 Tax=Pseudarthrobacter chlorophenolicus (strain ATCC 700700 / DSM 12829 / CIP 107037 / JCM 12360 / KCTC 9906 / NCIMB 13794 / A6) TaxID=452863 RepID=B8H9K9_PSECP|nr:MFS transporter [Pseudarthrobacter chlorophenolicus]ACL40078.1 major facilitator superfamily MFS_1 [Pseudarthrobacter chlorophenolicus A6]SDQ88226.1 MFS transporter, DHA2 family, methylenomycin A resistance protein [Pseudarthrobacter chlorophenolicus]
MSVSTASSPAVAARPRASLGVAMLGFFVVALDAQIVNVALPAIRNDLGGGLSGLQWVVTGYALMFSALQLFAGTFSDRAGARRAYGMGMILFVVASAACALSPSLPALVGARILQGIGAAMITPASLALIREAYHDAAARGRATVYWGLGGSVAAAAGPVLGGLLTQLDWRLIFFVNLPVGAVALGVLSRVAVSPRRAAPFDWTGQISAVVGLAALTYGIIEGAEAGYESPAIVLMFAVAVAAITAFVFAQAWGRHPMIPLDLFRSRTVSTALTIAVVTMAGFYGIVFVQSLYFQQERGASALETGVLFLPMTALVAILNPWVARLMGKYGHPAMIATGQLIMAAGLAGLCLLPADAPVLLVAALMVPVGVGGSFTVPSIIAQVMDNVPAERAGTASGVVNTARQVGGTLGVAIFGAVIASGEFITGLRASLGATAVVLIVLIVASMAFQRRPHTTT